MNDYWLLPLLGFMVGAFGTLIGAGGGFIMVPALIILYPDRSPSVITALSLSVVFFNSVSGSIAYALRRRIDYRSVAVFSVAAIPGTFLGVYAAGLAERKNFELIFGFALGLLSLFLIFGKVSLGKKTIGAGGFPVRILTDGEGVQHEISYDARLGAGLSAVVGFLSSFLGIGGGVIHVPALVRLLNFPVHIATATSHAILAVMSMVSVSQHLVKGTLDGSFQEVFLLAPGVILGAQLGAYISGRISGGWIIRALAVALLFVGLRIAYMSFH